jgi:hypothetical protein
MGGRVTGYGAEIPFMGGEAATLGGSVGSCDALSPSTGVSGERGTGAAGGERGTAAADPTAPALGP